MKSIGFTKIQLTRIHTSSLISIKRIFNRPIIKFYNGHEVNMISAELRAFHKKHNLLEETIPTDVHEVLKTKCLK